MGLPSFPTSRWLELSHQISACLDKRFLRFNCRGIDVHKDHFAQSRTMVGKAENEGGSDPFLLYFLSPHCLTLPCCPANTAWAASALAARTVMAVMGQPRHQLLLLSLGLQFINKTCTLGARVRLAGQKATSCFLDCCVITQG